MRRLIASAAALLAVTLPMSAEAQEATHNWTGFYAGLHAGGGWGNNDVDVGCKDPTGVFDGTANCSGVIALGDFPTSFSTDLQGFIGGGQLGYNFQTGNIVLGIEADISGTSIDGSDSKSPPPVRFPGFPEFARVSQDLDWFGTVRGRVGLTTGNWLLYATGGLAYAKVDYKYSWSIPNLPGFASDSSSSWQTGWTIGGGAELGLGQWSLKGEYLFYDLGSEDLSAQAIAGGTPQPTFFEPDFETRGHIARVGLNYHFD